MIYIYILLSFGASWRNFLELNIKYQKCIINAPNVPTGLLCSERGHGTTGILGSII